MGPWWTRRRRAAYRRVAGQVAAREAVRTAEEIVGTAWMAGLQEAEGQAATACRICTHMRDTAYEVYRSAQAARDTDSLTASYRELAASQDALSRIRDRHDGLRAFAARERTAWAEAERTRALEVLADRDRLAEAAHAAGMEKERTHEHR
jgi:hypothetical protein